MKGRGKERVIALFLYAGGVTPDSHGLSRSGVTTRGMRRTTTSTPAGVASIQAIEDNKRPIMARTYSSIYVHLVFSTKNRKPFLKDPELRTQMHAQLGAVSKKLGCQPLIVGGVENHVHILATLGKTISQSEWVKEVKRVTSIWAKEQDPSLSQFKWQMGCGLFSVSSERVESIRHYIRNQEEHHKTVSFIDEFLALLKEHDMEFDSRDSFDE